MTFDLSTLDCLTYFNQPGASCSKLTMSLVNVSLKYALQQILTFFQQKNNNSGFDNIVSIYLTN